MSDANDGGPRRLQRGAVITAVALVLVLLAGGAFAVGRDTAPPVSPRSTYSQTSTKPAAGQSERWMRHHHADITWMRQHPNQWQWLRHHPTSRRWMREHMDDMVWLRHHPTSWRWMRRQMGDTPWLRGDDRWRGVHHHPSSWSGMRHKMNHMMGGQGTWQR